MLAETFYRRFGALLDLRPAERHAGLLALHAETLAEYSAWVQAITPAAAASPSSDGRPISLVVGHIAAWDRFLIQACGEMLSGAEWPSFMDLQGYLDEDGRRREFESIDAFNAHQAGLQHGLAWDALRSAALERAASAAALFAGPGLLTAERLERTRPTEWRLHGDRRVRAPVGWEVWMIIMEHESVEHAADLSRAAAG
jgi:hypothetical protein